MGLGYRICNTCAKVCHSSAGLDSHLRSHGSSYKEQMGAVETRELTKINQIYGYRADMIELEVKEFGIKFQYHFETSRFTMIAPNGKVDMDWANFLNLVAGYGLLNMAGQNMVEVVTQELAIRDYQARLNQAQAVNVAEEFLKAIRETG